jgi:hypothetical protein
MSNEAKSLVLEAQASRDGRHGVGSISSQEAVVTLALWALGSPGEHEQYWTTGSAALVMWENAPSFLQLRDRQRLLLLFDRGCPGRLFPVHAIRIRLNLSRAWRTISEIRLPAGCPSRRLAYSRKLVLRSDQFVQHRLHTRSLVLRNT